MRGFVVVVSLDGRDRGRAEVEALAPYTRPPQSESLLKIATKPGVAFAITEFGDVAAPAHAQVIDDARILLAADARLDAPADLRASLGKDGGSAHSADELIRSAYLKWDTDCLRFLNGDYSFVIWDSRKKRLFCARDQFGGKPLYYARTDHTFICSNSLAAVIHHPSQTRSLDERAIGDFLTYGRLMDGSQTVYENVLCLPAAHSLVMEGEAVKIRRWWTFPTDVELINRKPADCAEEFVQVFQQAVADRLPQSDTSILLSGGRDSTTIAALAAPILRDRGSQLHGVSVFYEGLMPDRERIYAALTADRLNVPTKFIKADDYRIILDPRDLSDTQPIEEPLANLWKDSLRSCVATSHVVLTGFGGDAIFRESTSRLAKLAGSGRIIGALIEAVQYVRWHQRMPRPGIRTMLQKTRNRRFTWDAPPVWLNPDFRKRIGADERWSELISPPETTHRTRPEVEFNLIGSFWTRLFEEYHPTETGLPLEHRHPFFDLRVLRFVLSVPPAQWYNDKGLLRIGMVNRLPIEVVRREKSPLAYDPLEVRWKRDGSGWIDGATIGDNVRGFVDKDYVWKDVGGNAADPPPGYRFNFRPLMLSRWLEKKWVA